MADDVEAIAGSLGLERVVVMGWSFGSFVAQAHMVRHASASAYILMGTVAEPRALEWIDGELERFEPEHLRAQVAASWARESAVQTAAEAKQLMDEQWPFHLADPESALVDWLIENDHVVYRPEVLRHFSADGTYGLEDWRDELCSCTVPTLVLSGAADRTTAARSAHELAELLPNADEAVIADAAHVAIYEQPDATLAALRTFLARI
jgi:pimeloyl-ACP methyl ester carboxylesterase